MIVQKEYLAIVVRVCVRNGYRKRRGRCQVQVQSRETKESMVLLAGLDDGDDDDDEEDDDSEDNGDTPLHVLEPHLATHSRGASPELNCTLFEIGYFLVCCVIRRDILVSFFIQLNQRKKVSHGLCLALKYMKRRSIVVLPRVLFELSALFINVVRCQCLFPYVLMLTSRMSRFCSVLAVLRIKRPRLSGPLMDFDANMIVIPLRPSHQTVCMGSRVSDNCPNPVILVAIERVLNPSSSLS